MHACYTEEAIIIFGRKVKEQNASEYNKNSSISTSIKKYLSKPQHQQGQIFRGFQCPYEKKKIIEIKDYESVKIYKEEMEELRKDHSTTSQILT